jgi:hypothetical protein
MKVICISTSNFNLGKGWEPVHLHLTIGKMYDVIETRNIPFSPSRYDDPSGTFYKIKCDNREEKHFQSDRFRELTLDEKRELKINDILEL